ncbi:MAG: 50S ribosomal protein L22 [Actinobacteria bacterium]|nr:MAG: 50S ribosomal protein L22 [Actinomycetota bacterium]
MVAPQETRARSAESPREVRAEAKWVRSSARKARLVTDQIRGRSVPEARTILAFSQRAIAREVEKVLNSAVANAESRPDLLLNGDHMVVSAAYADEGPTMKRWRARARGRVARIHKRTCHITVRLVEAPTAPAPPPPDPKAEAAVEEKPKRKPAAKKLAPKKTAARKKTATTTRKKKETRT